MKRYDPCPMCARCFANCEGMFEGVENGRFVEHAELAARDKRIAELEAELEVVADAHKWAYGRKKQLEATLAARDKRIAELEAMLGSYEWQLMQSLPRERVALVFREAGALDSSGTDFTWVGEWRNGHYMHPAGVKPTHWAPLPNEARALLGRSA